MSIYGNPVMMGGSGGGSSIIVSKSITSNGVYYASSDNADGYNPVTVNVAASSLLDSWDFRSGNPLYGTVHGMKLTNSGVTFESGGAVFDSYKDNLNLSIGVTFKPPITIHIEVGAMSLTSGTHRRFIMATSNNGFIYRSTGVWAFYNGAWENSSETDGSFFENSTIEILVDADEKWHISKNGVLWFEPTISQSLNSIYIGASTNSIVDTTIKTMSVNW